MTNGWAIMLVAKTKMTMLKAHSATERDTGSAFFSIVGVGADVAAEAGFLDFFRGISLFIYTVARTSCGQPKHGVLPSSHASEGVSRVARRYI